MKKIYMIRNNIDLEGESEWITMDSRSFGRYMRSETADGNRRCFGALPDQCDTDVVYLIECDPYTALQWKKEQEAYLEAERERKAWCSKYTLEEASEKAASEPLQETHDREEIHPVYSAMSRLSVREQEILYMLYLTDPPISVAEASRRLGISRTALYKHKTRALSRLRKQLSASVSDMQG